MSTSFFGSSKPLATSGFNSGTGNTFGSGFANTSIPSSSNSFTSGSVGNSFGTQPVANNSFGFTNNAAPQNSSLPSSSNLFGTGATGSTSGFGMNAISSNPNMFASGSSGTSNQIGQNSTPAFSNSSLSFGSNQFGQNANQGFSNTTNPLGSSSFNLGQPQGGGFGLGTQVSNFGTAAGTNISNFKPNNDYFGQSKLCEFNAFYCPYINQSLDGNNFANYVSDIQNIPVDRLKSNSDCLFNFAGYDLNTNSNVQDLTPSGFDARRLKEVRLDHHI